MLVFKYNLKDSEVSANQESIDSVMSYGIGGGTATFAFLADATEIVQFTALLLGLVVVVIRVVHDSIRLYKYIRKGE